jgi:nardilysin
MASVAVEAFYHGNVDSSDADAAQKSILMCLDRSGGGGLSKKKYPTEAVIQIPRNSDPQCVICPTKNVTEANTAVEVYFQIGKDNITDRVMIDMLTHMMAEPLYDQLRTKDQFGYSVSCDARWTCGIMGVFFSVVSSTKSAVSMPILLLSGVPLFVSSRSNHIFHAQDEIAKRIDSFLLDFRNELNDMKKEQFMEHLVGLAKNKLEMFNSLSEETGCYWSEIQDNRFEWEVYRNEALELRSLTKELVLTAFDDWLLPSDEGKKRERRALVVQVIGSGETASAHGRPNVDSEAIPAFADEKVRDVHKSVGGTTWGKVY